MIFTEQNLETFFKEKFPIVERPEDPKVNIEIAKYCLSFEIIKKATSPDWIYNYLRNSDKTDKYLFRFEKDSDSIESKKHRARLFLFAEMLYNLQYVSGIQRVFSEFGKEDFESLYIELEFAKYIYRAGINFWFNTPKGDKGSDYDIAIELNGENCAGEIKTKLESNEYSPKKIIQTIKDSKKQLPKKIQNFIFIKIPESWAEEEHQIKKLVEEVKKYIDKSSRVLTIVLLWNKWIIHEEGDYFLALITQEIKNKHSILNNGMFRDILFEYATSRGEEEPWFDLLKYVKMKVLSNPSNNG